MKWTYDWLKDYLETDATAQEIADTLTHIGLEVEGVEFPTVPVAAKIVEYQDIPDTHLHLLKVDDGGAELRQVVCGAPNARPGLMSALAVPGCKIGGMEIKSGRIRGILSDGMMCSGKELGISDDHDGIIELDASNEKVGQTISALRAAPNAVFDAGITPNRPDYLAVCGIARDLSAAGAGKFISKYDNYAGEMIGGARRAIIENKAACPDYCLCEIKNIKMAPSNARIAGRLSAIGITPRNAPIDATNYICYDLAQPMHCFDADEIHGDIIIRNAKMGEKFTDLFDNEYELVDTDLVIADEKGILALAGVIGGARGMTTDKTTNILLESAYFDPVAIRKTSKRLGISTDASYRYERGIDPTITFQGIMLAVKIITDTCGGNVEAAYRDWDRKNPKLKFISHDMSKANDIEWLKILEPRRIDYTPELFLKKTGINLDAARQKEILESLGFGVDTDGDNWTVIPTPARIDVLIPENIVSEVIRIYGYTNIKIKERPAAGDEKYEMTQNHMKMKLCGMGLSESVSYGFGHYEKEMILSDRANIKIKNPIAANFDTMRNSLVQNMLDVISLNDRFRRSNAALFEMGAVFDGSRPGQQHDQLIIARAGIYGDKIGIKHGREVDIYDVREDLLALFPAALVENDDAPPKWAHPFRAGRLVSGGRLVARFAELHPAVAKRFGIKTGVVLGLIDYADSIPELNEPDSPSKAPERGPQDAGALEKARISLAEFPLITRDFAFSVDSSTSADLLTITAQSADGRIIETNVFDEFDLGGDKKSVAFEIVIQPESNMSDTDLLELQNAVIAMVEKNCSAKIRDK
ncbi:MAG: phenylalanine--tRNA ligase subunit beta [Rickettsiales bacterium]|jgi:phenylalanyl-tRNA synthetase beta chain|nr:phenylalanine--tRNA ligase subunit beta [Rickettsiales bacterium]